MCYLFSDQFNRLDVALGDLRGAKPCAAHAWLRKCGYGSYILLQTGGDGAAPDVRLPVTLIYGRLQLQI